MAKKPTNEGIGDMYLVLLRHSMDDLPIVLTPDQHFAEGVASTLPPDGVHARNAEKAMQIDCSTPINTAVLRFRADGTPRGLKIIHTYTDEELKAYSDRAEKRWAKQKRAAEAKK